VLKIGFTVIIFIQRPVITGFSDKCVATFFHLSKEGILMKTIWFGLFVLVSITYSAVVRATWLAPSDENLLVMQLKSGRVVMQLAPDFAPKHVRNIKQLVSQNYFDGSMILRSQDNYVVQWGIPEAESGIPKSIGKALPKIKVEFYQNLQDTNFVEINSRDAYADKVGFVDGFPAASDGKRVWLAHCYGMLGVSRDVQDDSGNGSGLYVVTGHAPRHLDRNVTLVGRVLEGMHLLSSLPRGTGNLGFYESDREYVPVQSIKMGSAVEALGIKIMDTNSEEFSQHVAKRTTRTEDWFLEPSGKIELCNVGVPKR